MPTSHSDRAKLNQAIECLGRLDIHLAPGVTAQNLLDRIIAACHTAEALQFGVPNMKEQKAGGRALGDKYLGRR